jgi:rod shape-determining protein MreC
MFSKQTALIAALIVLIVFSFVFLALSSRRPHPSYGPGRLAIMMVAPFQKAIVATTRQFREVWYHYFFLVAVVEDNSRLRQELQQLQTLRYRYEEARQANERLQALLALVEEIQRPAIAARVVGKDPSPWFQTILVDKGRADGVEIGLPVINPQGVVGLVVDAARGYSKVMLITDPSSAVDAMVQDSRARGVIKGGTVGYCVLNYVLRQHSLSPGDAVVASGLDGVFPKGMPIGQVSDIVKNVAGLFQDVTVTPYVDFERLEEVLIVPHKDTPDPS